VRSDISPVGREISGRRGYLPRLGRCIEGKKECGGNVRSKKKQNKQNSHKPSEGKDRLVEKTLRSIKRWESTCE